MEYKANLALKNFDHSLLNLSLPALYHRHQANTHLFPQVLIELRCYSSALVQPRSAPAIPLPTRLLTAFIPQHISRDRYAYLRVSLALLRPSSRFHDTVAGETRRPPVSLMKSASKLST